MHGKKIHFGISDNKLLSSNSVITISGNHKHNYMSNISLKNTNITFARNRFAHNQCQHFDPNQLCNIECSGSQLLLVGLSLLYFDNQFQSIVLVHACNAEVLHISCNMGTRDLPDMQLCPQPSGFGHIISGKSIMSMLQLLLTPTMIK